MNLRAVLLLLLTLTLAACVQSGTEAPPSYKIYVVDGDTFALNNVKIRVIGVDTMEYKHPQKSYVVKKLGVENISCLDYYGEQAYLFAREVLENSMINVQEVRKDKYGRTLAYVTVCNETACYDYGELLLGKGLAIVYEYEDFEKKQEYKEIQEEAKKRKLGLWSCT